MRRLTSRLATLALIAVAAIHLAAGAALAADKKEMAAIIAGRFYSAPIEQQIYESFWPKLEDELKVAKPDLSSAALARAQIIAGQKASDMFEQSKGPLVDAIAEFYTEDELSKIVAVKPGYDFRQFLESELGAKVRGPGAKAVNKAINGPVLENIKNEGETFVLEVIAAAVAEGLIPPPENAEPVSIPWHMMPTPPQQAPQQ